MVSASRVATVLPNRFPHKKRTATTSTKATEGPSGTTRRDEDLGGLGGDFGARDATAGELESNFNAKSTGEADTEHMLQVPAGVGEWTSLHLRSCVGLVAGDQPLEERQALVYQKQVIDWKIRKVDAALVLRREFRTETKEKAQEVVTRFTSVAESEGQQLRSFIEGPGTYGVRLSQIKSKHCSARYLRVNVHRPWSSALRTSQTHCSA